MRYKKTEICQTCSRAKNVCQTCLLDLEYGLPVQVRDSLMNVKQDLPKDEVNRAYYNQCLDKAIAESDPNEAVGALKAKPPSDTLAKLARTSPYYKRNRAHICSFWVKGECRRGEECPYRHDKPSDPDDPLSDQNLKDRYYGSNDPVAEKLLKRAAEMPRPTPPEDKSITTVYVGNVGEKITEKDLRDHFYQFGEIRTIHLVPKQSCAFITYTTRTAAEMAVEKSFQKLVIHGQKLVIRWGRSQAKRGASATEGKPQVFAPVPGLPIGPPDYFSLGSSEASSSSGSATSTIHYPSQDPQRLGATAIKLPSYNRD